MTLHNIHNEKTIALIEKHLRHKHGAKAIKLCNRELIALKENAPADIYVFLSMAQRYSGKKDIAFKVIDQALTKHPYNSNLTQEKSELLKSENLWTDPETYLDKLQKIVIPETIQYKQLNRSLKDSLKALNFKVNDSIVEDEDCEALLAYNSVMQSHIQKTDVQATNIYKVLLQGKTSQSQKLFSKFLNTLDLSSSAKELWNNAFNDLSRIVAELGYSQKNDEPKPVPDSYTDNYKSKYRKIISSGMGWSGSGALTAYLREFHQVDYVDVCEFSHIEGPYGLANLRCHTGDKCTYINYLINMFAYTLFGFGLYEKSDNSYEIEKSKLKTRRFLNHTPYIEGVSLFLKQARYMHDGKNGISYKTFSNATNMLMDKICQSFAKGNDSIILMDNVIHIQEVKNIEYLNNTQVVCVYRDPRSNYVALVEEDWKRGRIIQAKGAAAYANFYKRMRRMSELSIKQLSQHTKNIHHVQFEKFVRSPDYRNNIADKLNLYIKKSDKHTFFNPDESIKNTENYKKYKAQDEIQIIEKKLPEYLYPH